MTKRQRKKGTAEAAEDYMKLRIRVDHREFSNAEFNQLCSILRALFYANGSSDGQALKNSDFRSERVVEFLNAPMAREFLKSVKMFLKKSARQHVAMQLVAL
jgi:hypothetical protein